MQSIRVAELLSPARVDLDIQVSSKKRLLEHMAAMLTRDTDVDQQSVFRVLIERERLGSTGVGHGVALPHGRLEGINDAILALAVLNEPLDYESPDQQDVRIVVGLLVPENANESHLQILAGLAELLNRETLRERLLQADDSTEIVSALKDAQAR